MRRCATRHLPRRHAVLEVLTVTFPFFALVLAGYVAVRRSMLPLQAIPGMNVFVLYFALPCLLYRFGASLPIERLLDGSVFGVYLVCALVMVAVTLALSFGGRIRWNDAAFGALTAAFPNSGFMGVPLLVALLGERAAAPVIVTIATDMVITTSLCIALSRLDSGGAGGARAAAGKALRGIATNPMPWAILLGGLTSASGFEVYPPLMNTLSLLADASSPAALFTIGAVIARSRMHAHTRTPAAEFVPLALLKLLLHPLLVFFVGASAIRLGVPLDPYALMVLILVAALPSASNVSLLAERYEADNGRVAMIILMSTVLSFFSFSAAVALLTQA